jgi:hypothetical protein
MPACLARTQALLNMVRAPGKLLWWLAFSTSSLTQQIDEAVSESTREG